MRRLAHWVSIVRNSFPEHERAQSELGNVGVPGGDQQRYGLGPDAVQEVAKHFSRGSRKLLAITLLSLQTNVRRDVFAARGV